MNALADAVHTLDDLETWSFPGPALAVLGRPVAHSLSPAIHHAALAALARTRPEFAGWGYFKFDIAPADLPQALAAFHLRKFRGLNLTVPHKSLAVEHLVAADDFVRAAGAANTLSYSDAGWRGSNTDGDGLSAALREELAVDLPGRDVILLGAGGAARGAAIECFRAGVASLSIGNRTASSLAAMLAALEPHRGATSLRGFDLAAPPATLPPAAIVINATSLGLGPDDPAPVDLRRIPAPRAVFDMIYRPPRTALLRAAAGLGLAQANGLAMLVHQGARSLALWTGAAVDAAVMAAAARAALRSP